MPSRRTFFRRASGIVAAAACALYIPSDRLEFGVPKALAAVDDVPVIWWGGEVVIDRFRTGTRTPDAATGQIYGSTFGALEGDIDRQGGVTLMDFARQWRDRPLVRMFGDIPHPSLLLSQLDEALDAAAANGLSVSEIRLTREDRDTLTAECGVNPDAEPQDGWNKKRLAAYPGIPVFRADRSGLRVNKV